MAEERSNADVARDALRRWSEGDLDGTLETMSPDIEWHMAFALPDLPAEKKIYHGHDEVRTLWHAFRSVWDEITLEIEEVIYDDGSLLVLSARFHAHGTTSGIDLDQDIFYVMELGEDQLLHRLRPFETAQDARAAVGLDD